MFDWGGEQSEVALWTWEMLAVSWGMSRVVASWTVAWAPGAPMVAMKVMEGRKEREREREGVWVVVLKVVGVRVDSLLLGGLC